MPSTEDIDLAWLKKIWEPGHIVEWNFLLLALLTYTDLGKASGNLETKYMICNCGLTFTQEWNTVLGTEISLENKLEKRLFVSSTGKKSRKLKASYKWACFHLGNNVDIDISGPVIYDWALKVGLLAITWVLTQPNPDCHRVISLWVTRLQTSSYSLTWTMALNLEGWSTRR